MEEAKVVLLSRGARVSASTTEQPAFPPSSAVDGDLSTRWSSAFSDPQWLTVDLGRIDTLTAVTVYWEVAAAAKAYQIRVSSDGVSWRVVYSTVAEVSAYREVKTTGSARYVQVAVSERATGYGCSMWELEVFGHTGGIVPAVRP